MSKYSGGTRETWRGWQWNRLVERLPEFDKHPIDPKRITSRIKDVCRHKTAIYLIGPDDADRKHALKYGFHNDNLYGIDITAANVTNVRSQNNLAINTDLASALLSWKSGCHIDVISADLTCGLSNAASVVADAMLACPEIDRNTVVSINLQRGRDAASNHWREAIRTEGTKTIERSTTLETMHRGKMIWDYMFVRTALRVLPKTEWMNAHYNKYHETHPDKARHDDLDNLVEMHTGILHARALNALRVVANTYKSTCGNIRMDSIVFRFFDIASSWGPLTPNEVTIVKTAVKKAHFSKRLDKQATFKLGAFKALRTMRQK